MFQMVLMQRKRFWD